MNNNRKKRIVNQVTTYFYMCFLIFYLEYHIPSRFAAFLITTALIVITIIIFNIIFDSIEKKKNEKLETEKFHINHNLELQKADSAIIILENITKYEVIEDKVYMCSEDGYAVISENGTATIYINNYNSEANTESNRDAEICRNGKRIVFSKRYNDPNIMYLENFEEFSDGDRKNFAKISKW